mmetsp:Transcript_9883/g.16621  ORF Transcript_9883/g.16621 Transcript_9883/m.16621 type:complete len:101 (+) Transcript_9883:263-565(+)
MPESVMPVVGEGVNARNSRGVTPHQRSQHVDFEQKLEQRISAKSNKYTILKIKRGEGGTQLLGPIQSATNHSLASHNKFKSLFSQELPSAKSDLRAEEAK